MGRVKVKIKIAAAALFLTAVLTLNGCSCSGGRDPTIEKEGFSRTIAFTVDAPKLEPWEALYVTGTEFEQSIYRLILREGVYRAELKAKRKAVRYTYVVGDEWGNLYGSAKADAAGEREIGDGLIVVDERIDRFDGELPSLPPVRVHITVIADIEGELSIAGSLTGGKRASLVHIDRNYLYEADMPVGRYTFRVYRGGNSAEEAAEGEYTVEVSRFNSSFELPAHFKPVLKTVEVTFFYDELPEGNSLWLMIYTADGTEHFRLMPASEGYTAVFEAAMTDSLYVAFYLSTTEHFEDILTLVANARLDLRETEHFFIKAKP